MQCCRKAISATSLAQAQNFSSHLRLHVLQLVTQNEATEQLLHSNPALLWLIVQYSRKQAWPESRLKYVFGIKRIDMLPLLGVARRKCALTVLNKLALEPWLEHFFDELCFWLHHPRLSDLVHYPKLTANHLALFKHCPELIGSRWSFNTEAIQTIENIDSVGQVLADCVRMANQLNRSPNFQQQLRHVNSLTRFQAIHDDLTQRIIREQVLNNQVAYPKPPFPGRDDIEPITDSSALLLESEEQYNCVFSYHRLIMFGHYYVYRVLSPQRATLGIYLKEGEVKLDQLYLRQNQPVSSETSMKINIWIRQVASQEYFTGTIIEWK